MSSQNQFQLPPFSLPEMFFKHGKPSFQRENPRRHVYASHEESHSLSQLRLHIRHKLRQSLCVWRLRIRCPMWYGEVSEVRTRISVAGAAWAGIQKKRETAQVAK